MATQNYSLADSTTATISRDADGFYTYTTDTGFVSGPFATYDGAAESLAYMKIRLVTTRSPERQNPMQPHPMTDVIIGSDYIAVSHTHRSFRYFAGRRYTVITNHCTFASWPWKNALEAEHDYVTPAMAARRDKAAAEYYARQQPITWVNTYRAVYGPALPGQLNRISFRDTHGTYINEVQDHIMRAALTMFPQASEEPPF